MRPIKLCCVVMLAVAIAPARAAAAALDDAGYIAFGDLRGHIEPCGCDPATDLGGLRRLAELVQRERRNDATLASFCTGNILAPKSEGTLKTPFVLEGVALVPADVCLLNDLELQRLAEVKAAPRRPAFVLSNAVGRKDVAAVAVPEFSSGAFVALGFVSPSLGHAELEPLSEAVLRRWRSMLEKSKSKAKILLFAGTAAELAAAEGARLFDAIISSNDAPMDTVIGTQEKDDEHRLERQGSHLATMMAPLGGQGVLRGGKARFAQAKSIGELLQAKKDDPPKPLLGTAKVVTWLDASYSDGASLKTLFDRYNQAARLQFAGDAAARTKDLATTGFAGAEACAACHKSEYDKWASSKHAHAMATLQAKGKHEDPECVACHVLGAKEKGGFVSLAASPQLANVQCETCHGPRREHTGNPTIKPHLAQHPDAVCAGCHNGQHSPAFKQAEYWKKIAHGPKA